MARALYTEWNASPTSQPETRRSLDEGTFILEVRRGDLRVFEELVRRHQTIALRMVYLTKGSAAESEDKVQKAFVQAYHALPSSRVDRSLRPWLLCIAANQAQNAVKASCRRRAVGQRYAASAG